MMEKRKGALFDFDKSPLEKRMQDYFNPDIKWAEYQAMGGGLAHDAAAFDAEAARKKALKAIGFNPDSIVRLRDSPV